MLQFGIHPPPLPSPLPIHTLKGNFMIFQNKILSEGGATAHSAQSGAPTVATSAHSSRKQQHQWIHFILQRAQQEHSALSTLPTTGLAYARDSGRSPVLQESSGHGWTSHLASPSLHLTRLQRQQCACPRFTLLSLSFYLLRYLAHGEERSEGMINAPLRGGVECSIPAPRHPAQLSRTSLSAS